MPKIPPDERTGWDDGDGIGRLFTGIIIVAILAAVFIGLILRATCGVTL